MSSYIGVFVKAEDLIESFENEFWKRRNERYKVLSFRECMELLEEAIGGSDRLDKFGGEMF